MKSFRDKVAVITGAGSGMGRTLAQQLAGEGCNLALCDINQDNVEETATLLKSAGVKITTKVVDVASRECVYTWADEVVRDHQRVNLVFNNAGVAQSGRILDSTYEELEWCMNINYWGVVFGTKAFLPHLINSGDGYIVNTSSLFGLLGVPTMAPYNATKFAVRGFTECLIQELAIADNGVKAACVHPGGIKTNIALASRINEGMIGKDFDNADEARKKFNKLFTTTADEAARVILQGVRKNKRRILIGNDAVNADRVVRLLPERYHDLVIKGYQRMQKFRT